MSNKPNTVTGLFNFTRNQLSCIQVAVESFVLCFSEYLLCSCYAQVAWPQGSWHGHWCWLPGSTPVTAPCWFCDPSTFTDLSVL